MLLAFLIALLLNTNVRGMPIFRTLFYLPSVTAGVATAILWLWLLNPNGLVNYALGLVGIVGPRWFGSTAWAMPGLILMSLWSIGGTIIIYLAGLQSVPQQFYDAASIDGAGRLARLRYVTLPMMTPAIFLHAGDRHHPVFQVFTPALVITDSEPRHVHLLLAAPVSQRLPLVNAATLSARLDAVVLILVHAAALLSRRWSTEGETGRQENQARRRPLSSGRPAVPARARPAGASPGVGVCAADRRRRAVHAALPVDDPTR
jgi:multiple sugar transport system permease protein